MSEWIEVNERLPENNTHVLVACEGGNVGISFFCLNKEFLRSYGAGYSRKYQGKLSGYFELTHRYAYKITHWMPRPRHPSQV